MQEVPTAHVISNIDKQLESLTEDSDPNLLGLRDDIRELMQYERNLNCAIDSLSKYVASWQHSLRKLTNERQTVERKRLSYEQEFLDKTSELKIKKKNDRSVESISKMLARLTPEQQKAISLLLHAPVTND